MYGIASQITLETLHYLLLYLSVILVVSYLHVIDLHCDTIAHK